MVFTVEGQGMEGIRIAYPYASCNDCCIVYSTSTGAAPELVVVGCGWSCMLLLHPVPTCTDAGPDLCTWHPDFFTLCLQWLSLAAIYGGGVSPSAIGTDSPCTCGGFTHSNTVGQICIWLPGNKDEKLLAEH